MRLSLVSLYPGSQEQRQKATVISEVRQERRDMSCGYLQMKADVKKAREETRGKGTSLQITGPGYQPNPQAINQDHGKVGNEGAKRTWEREVLGKLP